MHSESHITFNRLIRSIPSLHKHKYTMILVSSVYIHVLLFYAVPTPTVSLTVLSSEPHDVGGTLSLQCQATVSHHINTPISVVFTWRRNSNLLTSDSRVTISAATAVSSLAYRSTLSISDLSISADSNMNYNCEAVVRSNPASPFILESASATSNSYRLNISGM